MKRVLLLLLAGGTLLMTSCETTKEITLQNDGSGTMTNTSDMSSLIGMAKMSGQGKEMDKLGDEKVDTIISLAKMVDSIPDLSKEEKDLVRKGTLGFNMNMEDEKFITKLSFPFSNPAQISQLDALSNKIVGQTMNKQMAAMGGDDKSGATGIPDNAIPHASIDDYFTTTYSKGLIEKKLNADKYAKVGDDETMKGMKEMAGMGIGNNTVIIHLPSPAKKVEGKNVTLSDDKKTVTVKASMEDFFDDATKMEFKVEY